MPAEIDDLLEIKRRAEREQLEPNLVAPWRGRLVAAIEAVNASAGSSILPVDPLQSAIRSADEWLREVRFGALH